MDPTLFLSRLFLIIGIVAAVVGLALIPVTPLPLIGALGWIAIALTLPLLATAMRRRFEGHPELRSEGAPGVATVLEAVPTKSRYAAHGGVGPTGRRVYRMRLRIEAEGIPSYEIEKRMVTEVGPSGREPGQRWPVFVDREDRSNILVDWETLEASGTRIEVAPGLVISSQGPVPSGRGR